MSCVIKFSKSHINTTITVNFEVKTKSLRLSWAVIQYTRYQGIWDLCLAQNQFVAHKSFYEHLGYMLLEKSYINMAIAVHLSFRKCLCDLPEPRYKSLNTCKTTKKGVAQKMGLPTRGPVTRFEMPIRR